MNNSFSHRFAPLPANVTAILQNIDYFTRDETAQALGFCLGGVTNQSWAIRMRERDYVIRLPREGTPSAINREAEKENTLAMSELGINLPTLFMAPEIGVKVAPFVEGAPLEPEDLRDPRMLKQISELLDRVHRSGVNFEASFRPCWLLEDLYPTGNEVPPEMQELQPVFQECRDVFLDGINESVPTHGDVYRGNLFQTRDRLYLIDWEHSGMNDPIYDLADFTIQAEFTDAESDEFLTMHAAQSNRLICRQRFFHARQLSRLVWRSWALARSKAT